MMSSCGMFTTVTVPSSLKLRQSSSRSCHFAAARVINGALGRRRTSSARACATNLSKHPREKQEREDAVDDDGEGERMKQAAKLFHPSIWGDFFLSYSTPLASSGNQEWMLERAQELKEEVAKMIAASSSSTCSLLQRLHLVDALERLCLDHLFQDEINAVLAQARNADVSSCDLETVALWYYLLRRHGYKVAPDVFEKFKNKDGSFAANNARGLLNLYNAAYLRTHGETILDEAIAFTRRRLESIVPRTEGSLERDIKCALDIPFPRRVRIYEAKYYISAYEREATLNEIITELAKLNSNLMQFHHQQELKIVTRWWNDLQVQSRLSFARNRVVECYFWMLGVYFEPVYSLGRIILTKVIAIVTILDDIYDVYGTSKECELFTKCIESWDRKAARFLPDYMEFVLGKILDTYQSMEDDLAPEEKYRMSYVRNFREQSASHVASTIDSCMKEHNVPIEMAREKIQELIEESWKDVNGEWLESGNTQPRQLLESIFNMTRTVEFIYKHDDAFTNCHTIKDTIH